MEKRVEMAKWFERHPTVFDNLRFSDEAHFWLSGYVNSHNAVYWGSGRPDEVLTKPLPESDGLDGYEARRWHNRTNLF